jgi:hypothetical protein
LRTRDEADAYAYPLTWSEAFVDALSPHDEAIRGEGVFR